MAQIIYIEREDKKGSVWRKKGRLEEMLSEQILIFRETKSALYRHLKLSGPMSFLLFHVLRQRSEEKEAISWQTHTLQRLIRSDLTKAAPLSMPSTTTQCEKRKETILPKLLCSNLPL